MSRINAFIRTAVVSRIDLSYTQQCLNASADSSLELDSAFQIDPSFVLLFVLGLFNIHVVYVCVNTRTPFKTFKVTSSVHYALTVRVLIA